MTIKAYNAGSLSLAEIRTEFGGPTSPISLFAYRAGGAYVPGGTIGYPRPSGAAVAVPTGGPISINSFYGSSAVIAPTYSISPSATNVNEGTSITFSITTTNVPNGTPLSWGMVNVTGSITPYDFLAPGTVGPFPPTYGQSGSVTINSNSGSFVVTFTADEVTDGVDSFQIALYDPAFPGSPAVATSTTVTVNDTSLTPASFTFSETISSNFLGGYNLRTRAMTAFVGSNGGTAWNGSTPLIATVTVNAGVYVIGTASLPAFTTGTPIPSGSTLTLTNNGVIGGLGGTGGLGAAYSNATLIQSATPGGAGGTAFSASYPINVYNNGTIGGGGGGGGGGGAGSLDRSYDDTPVGVK